MSRQVREHIREHIRDTLRAVRRAVPSDEERRFAAEVERAWKASGLTQTQIGNRIGLSRGRVSAICHAQYLPRGDTALHMIEVLGMDRDRTLRLLEDARVARRGQAGQASGWDHPLPQEIKSLLQAQISAAEVLPYHLPGARPVSLATLYVRQELGSGIEETPDDKRLADPATLSRPGDRNDRNDRDPGWRPQNPERFAFSVRPPSRPIRDALDEHTHLLVTGGPGQGKSTLTLRLAASIAEAWEDGTPPLTEPVIPLRLPARELATHRGLPFKEALAQAVLSEYGPKLKTEVPAALLAARVFGCRWLLLIDAIDEVADPSAQESLVNTLARWASDQVYRLVVTSRPLEGTALAPLHRAAAARYELQPFDAEALRLFAEHWFGVSDACSRFLDQVRQGRLEELIQVPLLATIAAIVFDEQSDRPLPDNKYSLYESYLEYLARRQEVPLDDILEHLALTRVETDAPLIETAQTWFLERTAANQRSADWRSQLIARLQDRGLLTLRGGRLQFLHHSFAEHLAATAKARRLPVPFAPDSEPWRSALHATRYGWTTDHARDVLLHYTHLNRDQADPLVEWLHHNTPELQEVAAYLLAQRAPASAAVIDSFLATVWAWAMTSQYQSRKILRRATHAAPAEWLDALMNEPETPWRSRIEAATALSARSPDAAALLQQAMNDPRLTLDDRLAAAQALANAGAAHRETATNGLESLLTNSTLTSRGRRAAAVTLADLGPKCRRTATGALKSILGSSSVSVTDRVHAAAGLAEIGIEFHDAVVSVFQDIAVDSTLTTDDRTDAALALGALGPVYIESAAAALELVIADWRKDPLVYDGPALALAKLGPEYVQVAAGHLCDMLAAPWMEPHSRHTCAAELAKLGAVYHDDAAAHLRRVLRDPTASTNDRKWAAMGLAKLGPEYHEEAAGEFRNLNTDPTADESDRWEVLSQLASIGPKFRAEAATLLRTALRDQGMAADERLWAAISLERLGPEFHREACETFRLIIRERGGCPRFAQIIAAAELETYGSKLHAEATATLSMIFASPTARVQVRLAAAQHLSTIAPEYLTDVSAGLRAILADDAVERTIRTRAARSLARLGGDCRADAAVGLAAMLLDPSCSAWEISSIANVLAEWGSECRIRAVDIVRSILTDAADDPELRRGAATALARLGTDYRTEAADVLRSVLVDPAADPDDCAAAASSLADLGEPDAGPALQEVVLDCAVDDYTWQEAVRDLARIDTSAATEAVRAVFSNSGATVDARRMAAECLVRLGDRFRDEATSELLHQVDDPTLPQTARTASAWALVRLEPLFIDNAIAWFAQVVADEPATTSDRCEAAEKLVQLDRTRWPEVTGMLRQVYNSLWTKPGDRIDVLRALRAVQGISASDETHALLAIAADPTASATTRCAVAERLERNEFVPRATFARLCRELLDDHMAWPSERVTSFGNTEAALRDVLASAEFNYATKLDALAALARLGRGQRKEAAAILRSLDNCRALLTLGHLSGRHRLEAIDIAREIIADPGGKHWEAVALQAAFGAEPDVDTLKKALENPNTRGVKAADWLMRSEWLRRVVDDRGINDHVRLEAAVALVKWDRAKAIAVLEELPGWRAARTLLELAPECREKATRRLLAIMTDPATHPSARIGAASAINSRHIESAAAVLREVAVNPRFKRRALFALGSLARPYCDEAVERLRELTEEPGYTTRWRAAQVIATLRRDLGDEAAVVARDVARCEDAPPHIRYRAAAALAQWTVLCREEAREILRTLARPEVDWRRRRT